MAKKAGSNEESRERTRAQLLQAGAGLLVDQAMKEPFAALRLRRLCERANLSTGAFYVHWKTLDEYHNDLARYLTEEDEALFTAEFAALSDLVEASDGQDALSMITGLAGRDLELLVRNPFWDARELVSLTWGRTHFRDELMRGHETIDSITGQLYGSALAKHGREPRDPLDWDDIGAILQGLVEGFGLRSKIEDAGDSAASESLASLYATAVAAIMAVLTRSAGDAVTVQDKVRDLLGAAPAAEGTGNTEDGPRSR